MCKVFATLEELIGFVDWINILATVILLAAIITLILAAASYFAYKVRESRQPKTAADLRQEGQTRVFFKKYQAR